MAYTPHQKRVAFHLYSVGRRKGASRKQILAALETGLVESNLGNPRGGDGTSSGWRQQIAGAGVKSQNRQNIRKQAGYFYDEIKGAKGARAGDLAAAVQRPAAQYRGRYNENAKQASDLLHYLEKTYGRGGGGKGGSKTVGGDLQGKLVKTPGVDNSALRTQIQQSYLRPGGKMPSQTALLSMAGQLSQAQDVPGETSLKLSRTPTRKVRTKGGGGGGVAGRTKVALAPGADRSGVKTSHYLRRQLSKVPGIPGGITITTGSNHNQMTVDGNVSDHWTGHAADIAVPVDSKRGDLIAGRALMTLGGIPRAKARQMAQRGGLYTFRGRDGKRYQVIWKTNAGGNHHNHVHVGVK